MRWDDLFADMESQLHAASAHGRAQEVAELTRAERASVLLADRLRASEGAQLRVGVCTGEDVTGVVSDVGATWVLLTESGREHLVPLAAVATVGGLGGTAAPPPGVVLRRLGLGHALRAVARDRSVLRVTTGNATVTCRIEAVAADHIDISVVGEDARPTGERLVVALAALVLLSRL